MHVLRINYLNCHTELLKLLLVNNPEKEIMKASVYWTNVDKEMLIRKC